MLSKDTAGTSEASLPVGSGRALILRPQVVERSRWISCCASSFERDNADIRSVILRHAHEEHRDYEILDADFVATGGELETIRTQTRMTLWLQPQSSGGYMLYSSRRLTLARDAL
jgi:hypothetical protein